MKTYFSENQFRLVGKAWEIRHYLKMARRQSGATDIRLADFLMKPQGSLSAAKSEANDTIAQRSHTQKQKKQDRRVIPFPSK